MVGVSIEREQMAVRVPAAGVMLGGDLVIPAEAQGIVLFAHGSGSSRRSPRNRFIAEYLQEQGLATLLIDLLTPEEERIDLETAELRFDIGLLAGRVLGATMWLLNNPVTRRLEIGYFGASTGAAAALVAAAQKPAAIHAVVSRGGRPDLVLPVLSHVKAPTLLIVGENDPVVVGMNRRAFEHLECEKRIEILPGATHLFEEPGALEAVALLAADWFQHHLVAMSETVS